MGKTSDFNGKFSRLLKAAQAKTDSDLARILGIHPSSVGAAKKRQQIPTGWVEKVASDFDVSADWLFFGGPEPEQPALTEPDTNNSQVAGFRLQLKALQEKIHNLEALLAAKQETVDALRAQITLLTQMQGGEKFNYRCARICPTCPYDAPSQ